MKNKSILFGLLATTALMLGACNGDQPASSEPKPSSEPSSEVSSSEPEPSSSEEIVDYGTLEAPISVEAANKIIEKELTIGEKTAQPLVVKGVMKLDGKEGYSQSYKNYTFYLHDEAKDAQKLYVFRAGAKEGLEEIAYENDTVIVSGYVVDYQGTYEMANSGDDKALLNSIVAVGTSSITVNCGENGSLSEIAASALNGTEISFTATPAAGYKVGSVKINGALIEAEEGTYKFTVKGNMTVDAEFVEEGAAETNYGSLEAPLSITEALAIAAEECKENGNFTAKAVVAKGLVKATKALGTYTSFRIDLVDVANAEVSILVYTLEPGEYKDLYAGDELIISGYIKNYTKSGSDPVLEFDVNGSAGVTPSILSLVRGKATVTLGAHEHATVTGLPEAAVDNGTEVSFTVEAESGYKVDAVKVNGKALEAEEGVYKFVAAGAMEVTVETSDASAPVATALATFELGENGEAVHADGSSATEYSEVNGEYTLAITDGVKLSKGARDAKGNGCLKLGTSKDAGSFVFALPEGVDYAEILVAGYKANKAIISINGGENQEITSASNDGDYTTIKVVANTEGKVVFETKTGGVRAMVNTIIFYANPK